MRQLTRSHPDRCLSDLVFDQWAAEELDSVARCNAEAHLAECPRCRAHKLELERARASFLHQSSFAQVVRVDEARARARPLRNGVRLGRVLAVGVAAAACLVLWLRPSDDIVSVRSKGAPSLGFFVKRADRVLRGKEGQPLHPGDVLRFAVTTDADRFLAVLSLDATGHASVFFPDGPQAARVEPGSRVLLNSAVELDQTLGREEVFGVFCPEPFSIEPLRVELSKTTKLRAPASCSVVHVGITKTANP